MHKICNKTRGSYHLEQTDDKLVKWKFCGFTENP